MRFTSRKHKVHLLKQASQLKGTIVYSNERLTKANADVAKRAKFLKKEANIQSSWAANCKVFVKLNASPEQAEVICIVCMYMYSLGPGAMFMSLNT